MFDDVLVKEYHDQLKRRTLAILRTVIAGHVTEEDNKEIDGLTTALVTFFNPQSFSGPGSAEIRYDKQYENMCLTISQHLHTDPKRFTVLEYYNAYDYIREVLKKAERSRRKRKS